MRAAKHIFDSSLIIAWTLEQQQRLVDEYLYGEVPHGRAAKMSNSAMLVLQATLGSNSAAQAVQNTLPHTKMGCPDARAHL